MAGPGNRLGEQAESSALSAGRAPGSFRPGHVARNDLIRQSEPTLMPYPVVRVRCDIVSHRSTRGETGVSTQGEPSAYALLTDGTTIEIRPARPEDFAAVRDLHAKMSPDNLYLRFFSLSPLAAEREARRICRKPAPDHTAMLALLDGELVGCGTFECAGAGSLSAEVAFCVL
jgi:hypothetical protein